MQVLVSLVIAILTYFVARLLFNEPISLLLAVLAGLMAFGGDYGIRNGWFRR